MSDAKKKADARYRDKRVQKTVAFNATTESDILAFANTLPDFSGWVKAKLKAEQASFNNTD